MAGAPLWVPFGAEEMALGEGSTGVAGDKRRPDVAARVSQWARVAAPRTLFSNHGQTERRMVLVQWAIMPLVLAGCVLPPPRYNEPPTHVWIAAIIMAVHPLFYALFTRLRELRGTWPAEWVDMLLTATDVTVATLVFYSTVARPGYAQVLLYCTVALAAARYAPRRAMGITSLVALLLIFAALLPLHVAPPALASEIVGLYALTYLVGLLSEAEKAVAAVAHENAQLAHTVLQRNRELSALNGLIQALNAETEPQRILELGLAGVVDALQFSAARAYVPGRDGFRLAHALPLEGETGEHEAVAERRRHEAMRAATAGQTVVKGWHSGTHDGEHLMPGPLHVSVPVMLGGGVGAVIQVDVAPQPTAMTEAVLETLEVFCGELSIALENARLRGEAQRSEILQEKNRIAQELHDTVLQMLFTVGLRLQWSMEHLPAESPVHAALAEARHLSARAGGELRGAIFTLCSDIAEIGLVAAVERLVEEQAERAGWSARVLTSGEAPPMPVLVQNAAHRVAREALMNAYKHAGAGEVMVALRFTPAAVTVVVQDDGRGISDEALRGFRHAQDHFGLRTVAEQVEGLGGQFSIYNNDEEGAAVKAVIPLTTSLAGRRVA